MFIPMSLVYRQGSCQINLLLLVASHFAYLMFVLLILCMVFPFVVVGYVNIFYTISF